MICGINGAFKLADIIMVDCIPWSILGNPENGILISPYERDNHDEDDELFTLSVYLELLARDGRDFRMLRHKDWKKVIGNGSAEK